jgi:hypothetical protein
MNHELLGVLTNTSAVDYIDGDGHTLWKPDALVAAGFPVDFIRQLTFTHESDFSNPKYVIFDKNGMPVEFMEAVAALSLHYAVAEQLDLKGGVDYDNSFGGRGTQAREIARAIKVVIDKAKETSNDGE